MKVAVVGAGYAGLATCWHLLQKNHQVTVFDGGEGASHASTGLLHRCPGKKAIPTAGADEGMQATLELLNIAGSDTFLANGILRILNGERIRISDGVTVFSRKYLDGLKRACNSATFVKEWVESMEELSHFDQVVLTTGAESLGWSNLPLKKAIGQCLVCRYEEPLDMSILSNGHITVTNEPGICLVGSTYEHTAKPDPAKALALIDQVAAFYPKAKDFKILDILSGTRIAPKVGYFPIVEKITPKCWIFTGLGSRGLIYHSLLARTLVEQIE